MPSGQPEQTAGTHSPRRKAALTLRARLTLWTTLVVLLVAVAALVAVRQGLRMMLRKELNVALADEVYETVLSARPTDASPEAIFHDIERTSAGHLRHGWFLQLYSADGREVLWSSDNTPRLLRQRPIPTDRPLQTYMVDGYVLAESRMERTPGPDFHVQVGTSTAYIEDDISRVTEIITPVLLMLFLLAPVGGWLVAGRATAPLNQILQTSRMLHPGQLEERLPLRGTGDELDQLSVEINRFLDRIARYLERNSEFLANAAHELRSPLAAIRASVEVALSRARTTEQYEELLADLLEEAEQLGSLIDRLLLLAETDVGALDWSRDSVQLSQVISQSINMFAGLAEDQQIRLVTSLDDSLSVPGDASHLRQVMTNLIDNAIRFTPAGGQITILLKRSDGTAVLTISDSGCGIPADLIDRVFDRFYQVDPARQRTGGTQGSGLGLSICQSIVMACGGTIRADRAPEGGARFTVMLPISTDGSQSPLPAPRDSATAV